MKKIKFYTNEALCVVLHLSTEVTDFQLENNDKIFEVLEENNIYASNILDFTLDLENLIVRLYLQKDTDEILFYEKSVKDFCPELPIGSYIVIDKDMSEALNNLDIQKAFNLGDEIEVSGVSYDLTNQEILYRLNTYVVTQEDIDIVFNNNNTSEENEDVIL